jgi:hypothetical protein
MKYRTGKNRYPYINDLIADMQTMNCYSELYQILKKELQKQKHWKDQPRGKPKQGYRNGIGKDKYSYFEH